MVFLSEHINTLLRDFEMARAMWKRIVFCGKVFVRVVVHIVSGVWASRVNGALGDTISDYV